MIENAGSEAVALPSLTLMMMFEYVPTLALVAVFDSRPVVVLNTSHAGLFWIENLSASPSASEAGREKLYQTPDSCGGRRRAGDLRRTRCCRRRVTVIENAGSEAVDVPSLTLMTMFE